MKRFFFFTLVAAVLATGCSNENEGAAPDTVSITVDFEGSGWNALVDFPQYGGALLYPTGDDAAVYSWKDAASGLYSELTNAYADNKFWGGGVVISSYFSTDTALYGSSDYQLTVYADSAHSGTNCAVCNGYKSTYGDSRGWIGFKSGTAVIESLWVCPTTYSMNVAVNGNSYAPAITGDDYVKVVAVGYDAAGAQTGSTSIYLYNGTERMQGWTKWSLQGLGEVAKVCFDFECPAGADAFAQPGYFAFDDVTVLKQEE